MKIKLYTAWYDGWIGYYYDRRHRKLYLQLIPWIGLRISFGRR